MNNDPQQPFTHYPPPPPEHPPRKKRGPLFWILLIGGLVIAFGMCRGIIQASSSTPTPAAQATSTPVTQATTQPTATDTPAPTATDTPTPAPTPKPLKWTTTHTFTGNGSKKTSTFSVPDDWKILYTCTHQDMGVEGVLGVIIYTSDNTIVDVAVNATCKTRVDVTKGETEEHQGGDIYLSIDGTGDWTVQVQELK